MEYFRILNLIREPFSNSPEPDFFFHSPKHVQCLQKLELAIRLRRGLNVVVGHVGTGKTTLCRYLISQFAAPSGENEPVEAHLLMDPAFTSPHEFLTAVAMSFGIPGRRKRRPAAVGAPPSADTGQNAPPDSPNASVVAAGPASKRSRKGIAEAGQSEWQLKEGIKDYLFRKGVDENRTVLLIIDEGQKLPNFALEILREFLNYETNEYKLLQIVIFAQPEFQQVLQRMANVADRINLLHRLEPLNFRETRDMIRFRLEQAGEPGCKTTLFSFPGLLAIYLATRGYPRKVITLCHQTVLAMIIQNRTRAGWLLVRTCASRLASADAAWRSRSLRWAQALLILAAAVMIFLAVRPLTNGSVRMSVTGAPQAVHPAVVPETAPLSAPQVVASKQVTDPEQAPREMLPPSPETMAKTGRSAETPARSPEPLEPAPQGLPKILGKITLKDGRTIWWMMKDLYGAFDQGLFRSVAQANPHIRNLNRVAAGQAIHIPALPVTRNPLAPDRYWVQILTSSHLEKAYEFYRAHEEQGAPLKLLPTWNPRQGVVFTVVLKDGMPDETSARHAITRLPAALASEAGVLKPFAPDTVFFTR
jgi:general secretion pathway protein A